VRKVPHSWGHAMRSIKKGGRSCPERNKRWPFYVGTWWGHLAGDQIQDINDRKVQKPLGWRGSSTWDSSQHKVNGGRVKNGRRTLGEGTFKGYFSVKKERKGRNVYRLRGGVGCRKNGDHKDVGSSWGVNKLLSLLKMLWKRGAGVKRKPKG